MKENCTVLIIGPALLAVSLFFAGCENLDDGPDKRFPDTFVTLPLDNVASLLAHLKLDADQLLEVHDAVSSSSKNGYDEEYMMKNLFSVPGSGVGDDKLQSKAVKEYRQPLRHLIEEYLYSLPTKAVSETVPDNLTVSQYLSLLESSDIQIYWPYSEKWDMESYPIITFDPADGSTVNEGYELSRNQSGHLEVNRVIVDENVAMSRPVWVVNRNNDSLYDSIELLRQNDASWGSGGSIEVLPASKSGKLQTLVLKDFTMKKHGDTWFGGASEFFVKMGSVDSFYASTEAELKLYSPQITDFMVVVRRKELGVPKPLNVVLVSDWTEQLTHSAFMVVEDDGGRQTSWKCAATVKWSSKSYGFEISIPLNVRDDIIWRGQLARDYIVKYSGVPSHFGDVDVTFDIVGR